MRPVNKLSAPIIWVGTLCAALLIGAAVPLLPVKVSSMFAVLILTLVGGIVFVLLPEKKAVPAQVIAFVLIVAITSKFLWPSFSYIPVPGLPSKNPQRWIWALALLYWIYSLATNKVLRDRLAQRLRHFSTSYLVGAFFLWHFLAIFNSDYPEVSVRSVLLELLEFLPAYLFALTWLEGAKDVRRVTVALVVALFAIALMTSAEALTKQNLFLAFVPIDPVNDEFLSAVTETKLRGGAYRAQASFNHPLLLAQFAVVVLPLAFAVALHSACNTAKALAYMTILAMPMVLWATQTRSALVTSAVVVVTTIFLLAYRSATDNKKGFSRNIGGYFALLTGLILCLGAAVLVYVLATGRTAEESGSTLARVRMFELAIDAAAGSPIFGYGPGVGGYKAALASSNGRASLDSQFLSQLLDAGVVAMLIYFLFFLQAGLRLFALRQRVDTADGFMATMWCLSVVAFGLSSLVLSTPHNMPLMFFGLGVVVVLNSTTRHGDHEFRRTKGAGPSGSLLFDQRSPR
jgi:O-antigen ligase